MEDNNYQIAPGPFFTFVSNKDEDEI